MRVWILLYSLVAFILVGGATVHAQDRNRPITIIVPYAEGGPTDKVARPIAQEMSRALGQEVRLSFRGGEGATKAPRAMVQAGADGGQTLLLHNIGMASAPTIYRHLGFDPMRDFEPIGRIADAPMMLLGRQGLPPTDGRELLAYLRANESSLTVAYGGPGGAGQLCGLMLERVLRLKLFWVPYTGTGPALNDLQRGRADVLCDQTTHAVRPLAAGVIKAYALTTTRRLSLLPDLPTTPEIGIAPVQIVVWHALYAVRGTPPAVLERLSQALQQAVGSPSFVSAMAQVGVVATPPAQATPQVLRQHLASEIARWRPLILKAGQFAD